MKITELKVGQALPELKKSVKQANINLYAEASHDFNPIHINEEFARKTPLGGTIAHGMLVLAYISEMMGSAFGESWLTGGRLNVRFKAPAHPGDTLTVSGSVRKIDTDGGGRLIGCEVQCQNQNSEVVITGEARVRVEA